MSRGDGPINIKDLIKAVEDETRSCSELERLDVAVRYGEILKGIGDDLVGHFVDRARKTGASWAQVGERLGVTRQAAHQRHVNRTPRRLGRRSRSSGQRRFERFTQEARDVITTAQKEARNLRHNYVGAEHFLLALSANDIVGPLLGSAGAPTHAILEQVKTIVGEGRVDPVFSIPFTPRAKRALELAARAADRSGQLVAPAHILLGVLDLRQGVGAEVIDTLGVSRDDLRRAAEAVVRGAE